MGVPICRERSKVVCASMRCKTSSGVSGEIGNGRHGELNTDEEALEVGISEGARFDGWVKHAIEYDGRLAGW